MTNYDIAIIGAGPGGYVAAIRAAQLGAKVCVIEKENLGGVCLNKGCIPTKTLLKSVSVVSQIKEASRFGVDVDAYHINFPGMLSKKKEVVERLNKGIESLFKARKIDLIRGQAKIISPNEVEITKYPEKIEDFPELSPRNFEEIPEGEARNTKCEIKVKNIIIATGSRPLELANFKFDGEKILSSDDILNIAEVPKSLLIVGGGVVGCEFATLFNELGAEITVVEMMEHILPNEDREIAKRLEGTFKKKGIKILTKTRVENLHPGGVNKVKLSNGEITEVEKVLVCVGRLPNTENLGLEDIGLDLDKGYIKVNAYLETNISHIFAIGDCIGGHLLAHVASYEGIIASENASGSKRRVDYLVVPNCVFTHPEVASVGLSEEKAKEKGLNVKVGKFPFAALGKAQATGEVEGLVKIVADIANDEILGAQILGMGATELIAELALAVKLKAKAKELADTIHAHPTMAEAIMEAAHSLHNGAIHLP